MTFFSYRHSTVEEKRSDFIYKTLNKDFLKHSAKTNLTFLNPTGYVMQNQFKIQQLYALPTLYLCVLYLSENKQRLVPITA
jgi:hypothetical protein